MANNRKVPIPAPKPRTKKRQRGVYLSQDIWDRIDATAATLNASANDVIAVGMLYYLDNLDNC